jgi:hypothetical protein
MSPLKKDQLREEDRYLWVCGHSPHTHRYPALLLESVSFSAHFKPNEVYNVTNLARISNQVSNIRNHD